MRWEEAGLGSDVHHLEKEQAEQNYRFPITRVPRGGALRIEGTKHKRDRYYYLLVEPILSRLYVPYNLKAKDAKGREYNIADHFIDKELGRFPIAKMDHLISALVLLLEEPGKKGARDIPELVWPQARRSRRNRDRLWNDWDDDGGGRHSWMAA